MKRLVGPTPEITDQRDAFDVLEGLPARADNVGEALLPYVPDVYFEGAIGWTGHCFNVNEIFDEETGEPTGEAVIYVPDELAAEHPDGTVVELPDGRFVTIDLSEAVDVQTQAGGQEMYEFTGSDGDPVWVRPVRVAAVLDRPGGRLIFFPGGEDPVAVTEPFVDVVNALGPLLVVGLLTLFAEDGAVAVNPRYVLALRQTPSLGTRVTMAGGREFDCIEALGDVVGALGL